MSYRITTVSRLDGKPTTKKFAAAPAAQEVWHAIKRDPQLYWYAAIFELRNVQGGFERADMLDNFR